MSILYKIRFYSFLFLVGGIFACNSSQNKSKIAVETFFNDAPQSKFNISPDGRFVSFIMPYKGQQNIYVKSLDHKQSTVRLTSYDKKSIRKFFWAGNTHILYVVEDEQKKQNYQLFCTTRDGKKTFQIKKKPNTKVDFIDHFKYNDSFILIGLNERDAQVFDVYKLNLENGDLKMVEKNPGNIIRWIADEQSNIRMAVGSDSVTQKVYYRQANQKEFKVIKSCNFVNTLEPVGFTNEEDHIYALSNLRRDKLALVDFDCKTGKEAKVLYENTFADIADVRYSKTLKKIMYITTEVAKRDVYFFDEDIKSSFIKLKKRLVGRTVRIVNSSSDENRFVLRTYSDKSPGAYYLYDARQDKLQKLAEVNPEINAENMCAMKPVSYRTRDGQNIIAYLTLPKGKDSTNLPCVILPHSGPYNRNTWGYSSEVQFFANRGYAVFQMNYRGSSGYGKKFLTSGFKHWGSTIQNDITDGVKWLISTQTIDPKRIAIYGYSFGGLAAMNQMIYEPDLYACAISNAGLLNLFTYIKDFPAYYKPYEQMLDVMIGNPEKDVDYLKYSSPVFHADKINKPLLILQGGLDSKVNVLETTQFVKELRKRKIEVNYILNKEEGHYLSNVTNRIAFYRQLESFLAVHLNQ